MGGMRPVEMFGRGLLCGGALCSEREEGQVPTQYLGKHSKVPVWSEALLEEMVSEAQQGVLKGTYGIAETNRVRRALRELDLEGKTALVIGSEHPWLEACLLEAAVFLVVTVEYAAITSTHPQVSTVTPEEARARWLDGSLPAFDAVVSFSSVEHTGLGRYGDALNPWGDIQQIGRAWCATKPGGVMLLGVPIGPVDKVWWNAHRHYNQASLPHLTANWRQVWQGADYSSPDKHPVMLFVREDSFDSETESENESETGSESETESDDGGEVREGRQGRCREGEGGVCKEGVEDRVE